MPVRGFFTTITRDPVSLTGCAITTSSAVLILSLYILESTGMTGSPYLGILAYLIMPAFFVLGLILIPIGIVRSRRRMRRALAAGEGPPVLPTIELSRDRVRKMLLIFLVLTLANIVILSTATYEGVEVMDSTAFCGTTCHTVMEPEYTAYRRSPHANVNCVECHIGPGAGWFVKSKLSGAWQVVAVTFNLYPTPIPTPIENLRPARETCEECHWPTKFVGDRLKVITHYSDDEANTELKTVLLMRVGGMQGRTSQGIHWHVDPQVRIRYRSDAKRDTIYAVELTQPDGKVKLFQGGDATAAAGDGASSGAKPGTGGSAEVASAATEEWRTMDCIDCHNRPTHVYRMPEDEVDAAIEAGRIDRSLPFVRREAIRILRASYTPAAAAQDSIVRAVSEYYRANYPDLSNSKSAEIDQAAREIGGIFAHNVFPAMNVTWGTYPNHLGHQNFPGCFRCHDDLHATADGERISQDCNTCHSVLAMEEQKPAILEQLNP
jgi:nitrate/TMAO reductase-like tetraheme cytochrome c subunit